MPEFVYPPVGFHFRVEVNGFPDDIGFQAVEGLDSGTMTEFTHAEGGENTYTHRFPDRLKYGDLTLKRGVLLGSALIQWFEAALQLFIFAPRDVTVTLLNSNHEPLEQWVFRNAWPKQWKVDNLSSETGTKVLAETIVLAYQYFYRKGLK